MLLLTLTTAMPCVNTPELVAVEQLSAVILPTGKSTALVKVQVCPPTLIVKLAVPLVAGVPVIVYVKLPAPLSKVPAVKFAVKPVTPEDVMVCEV